MKIPLIALFHKISLVIIILFLLMFTSESFGTNTVNISKGEINNEAETLTNRTGDITDNKPLANDYVLIWADEFNADGEVSSEKWHHQTKLIAGGSWANGELQHYTDRIENSYIEDGQLNIVGKRENFTDQGFTKDFTSARLNSKFAFTYGRVDVRAKLPSELGTWPAIWMLGKNISEPGAYWDQDFGTTPWPATGEIDIMEQFGRVSAEKTEVHGTTHTTAGSGGNANGGKTTLSTSTTNFHVYSIIWDEDEIQFLVDDVEYYTYNPVTIYGSKNASNWPFNEPQFVILNVAMGGILGGDVPGNFVDATMEIDYVRIYQLDDGSIVNQPVSAAPIPTDNPDNVLSIFSDTYANISGVDYSPIDGQSTIDPQVDIAGNNTLKYQNLNFQVTDFSGNAQDVSGMNSLHIDYWTSYSTDLNFSLISSGPVESSYALPITIGEWVSVDIPLAEFPNTVDLTDIIQLKFEGNGTVFLDNIYFVAVPGNEVTTDPDIAASQPIHAELNVISIFSDSYSNISGINYNLDLGQTTVTSLVNIEGNFSLKYQNLNFQVTDFSGNAQDVTEMSSLHVDYWTSNSTSLNIFLISSGPNEDPYPLAITNDEWVSIDIPLTEFTSPVDLMDIIQLKFEGDGTIYLDNIYFYNEASLESQTITFETLADKTLGDDPFTLNATVNSGLDVSFSSTSNNITLKDGVVTLLRVGRVTINAIQEGNFQFETATTVSQDFCINPIKGEITMSDENSELVTLTSASNIGNQWFLNGEPIKNAVGPAIKVESEGIYTVQITIDGCKGEISDDFSLVVTGTDLSRKLYVSVYPNPSSDYIQIFRYTGDVLDIDLLDLSGKSQKVIFKKTADATFKANIQGLPSGLYLLTIKGRQVSKQVRIIKN
jgi:beta-glucanase (GH16 family)